MKALLTTVLLDVRSLHLSRPFECAELPSFYPSDATGIIVREAPATPERILTALKKVG